MKIQRHSEIKDFVNMLQTIDRSRNMWEVWQDFITMYGCSISNLFRHDFNEEREQLYLKIAGKYTATQLEKFIYLKDCITLALENNPDQDFLGIIAEDLGLVNKSGRQYFTPNSIALLKAKLVASHDPKLLEKQHYISVYDPFCGTGSLLIAYANETRRLGINYQERILFVGQDIDYTAAMACYIQLSLLGCPGYIMVGNTLAKSLPAPEYRWYTPFYCNDLWTGRKKIAHMTKIIRQNLRGT